MLLTDIWGEGYINNTNAKTSPIKRQGLVKKSKKRRRYQEKPNKGKW